LSCNSFDLQIVKKTTTNLEDLYNTTASAITTPTPKPTSMPSRTTPSHAANQTTFKKKTNNYDSIKSMLYTNQVLAPTNIEWRRYWKMVPQVVPQFPPWSETQFRQFSCRARKFVTRYELYFDCGMWSVKHLLTAWYSDTQHHNGSHSAKGCLDPRGKSLTPSKIPNEVSISSGSHNAIAGGGEVGGGGGKHPTGRVTAVPHSYSASFLKAIVTSLG